MNKTNPPLLVIVTGGTKGLGLEIVRRLATDGYRVVATARNNSSALEELIEQNENRISYEKLDLSDISSIHDAVNKLVEKYGSIYGLINNAAIAHSGILATMHESQIEELLLVNVTGTVIFTKYALRSMLDRKQGRIVNIASIIASTGFNGLSVYAASKSALLGFTGSLAREVGKAGITVNSISPGYMETEMSSGLNNDQLNQIRRRSPMKALVTTSDVAATVAYFLSKDAQRVTGTGLVVDAGGTA